MDLPGMLGWGSKSVHISCLSYKKSPDAVWHLAVRLPHLVASFGLLSAKPATSEMWYNVFTFLNTFCFVGLLWFCSVWIWYKSLFNLGSWGSKMMKNDHWSQSENNEVLPIHPAFQVTICKMGICSALPTSIVQIKKRDYIKSLYKV